MKLRSSTKDYRSATELLELLDSTNISYAISKKYNNTSAVWTEASINSQEVVAHGFFLGLAGTQVNGGIFANQAVQNGASILMIEFEYESLITIDNNDILVIIVDDVLRAITAIARQIRIAQYNNCTIIAITGSMGKTTTKEITYAILNQHAGAVCSSGNLNTVQGLSLCLLNIRWDNCKFGVFECGISSPGEMQALIQILLPDHALVTNVGHAHIGGYHNIDELRKEKLSIASLLPSSKYIQNKAYNSNKKERTSMLWIPDNDAILAQLAHSIYADAHNNEDSAYKICTHGTQSYDTYVSYTDKQEKGLIITCTDKEFNTHLVGSVNVYNCLAALQVAAYFDVPYETSQKALASMDTVSGRYEVLQENPLIIDDSYNANPEAVKSAVLWFSHISRNPKALVLAGMKELGADSIEYHREVIRYIAQLPIEHVILYGAEFDKIDISKLSNIHKVHTESELIELLKKLSVGIQTLFFKGSRFYTLEHIARSIVRKNIL